MFSRQAWVTKTHHSMLREYHRDLYGNGINTYVHLKWQHDVQYSTSVTFIVFDFDAFVPCHPSFSRHSWKLSNSRSRHYNLCAFLLKRNPYHFISSSQSPWLQLLRLSCLAPFCPEHFHCKIQFTPVMLFPRSSS
jgi:hypothetical protein